MLPYLLAVLGGYLIGDSMDEKFADGGDIIDSEVLDQVSDYIIHKFDTTDFEVSIDNNVSPAKLKITYTGYDNAELDFLNAVNDDLFSGQGDKNYNTIEGDLPSYFSNYMKEGGKTYTFQEKVDVISQRLIGTKVPERLKKDYGEKYSKEEAIMAAKRIVGSQKSKYDKKKQLSMFSKGGLVEAKTQLMYALEKLSPTQKSIYQKELKKLEDVDLDIDDQMLSDYVNGWYGEEIVKNTDFTGPQAFNVGFKIMALDAAQKHPEFWEEVMMMADGGKLFSRKDKKFRYVGSDGQAHGINYKLFGIKPDGTKVEISEHTTQAGAERKAKVWEKTADGFESWTIDAVTFADGGSVKYR